MITPHFLVLAILLPDLLVTNGYVIPSEVELERDEDGGNSVSSNKFSAAGNVFDAFGRFTDEFTGGGFDAGIATLDTAILMTQALAPFFGLNAEVLSLIYLFVGDGSAVKDPVIKEMKIQFRRVNMKLESLKNFVEDLTDELTWKVQTNRYAELERDIQSAVSYLTAFLNNEETYTTDDQRQHAAGQLEATLSGLSIYSGMEKLYEGIMNQNSVFGGNLFDLLVQQIGADCSQISTFGVKLTDLIFRGAFISEIHKKLLRDSTETDWTKRLYLIGEKIQDTHLTCLDNQVTSVEATINKLSLDQDPLDIVSISDTINRYLQPVEFFMVELKNDDKFYGKVFHKFTPEYHETKTILYTYKADDEVIKKQQFLDRVTANDNRIKSNHNFDVLVREFHHSGTQYISPIPYLGVYFACDSTCDLVVDNPMNPEFDIVKGLRVGPLFIYHNFALVLEGVASYDGSECLNGHIQRYPHIKKQYCRCNQGYGGTDCTDSLTGFSDELNEMFDIVDAYNIPTLVIDIVFKIEDDTSQILTSIQDVQDNIKLGIDTVIFEMHFKKYTDSVNDLQDWAQIMDNYLQHGFENATGRHFAELFLERTDGCTLTDIISKLERYIDPVVPTSMYRRYVDQIATSQTVCTEEYVGKIRRVRSDMFEMQELAYVLLTTTLNVKKRFEGFAVGKAIYTQALSYYNTQNELTVAEELNKYKEGSCPSMESIAHLVDNHCILYDVLIDDVVPIQCESGYVPLTSDGSCANTVECTSDITILNDNSRWDVECTQILSEESFPFSVTVEDDEFHVTRSTSNAFSNADCLTFRVKYKCTSASTWISPSQDSTARQWEHDTSLPNSATSHFGDYTFVLEVSNGNTVVYSKSITENRPLKRVKVDGSCSYSLECHGAGQTCSSGKCSCTSSYYWRPTECLRKTTVNAWAEPERYEYTGFGGSKPWGSIAKCADNWYVVGYKMKSHRCTSWTCNDDEGVTDLIMYCAPYGEDWSYSSKTSMLSAFTSAGVWKAADGCSSDYTTGIAVHGIDVRADEGSGDDQGITDIEMNCKDGSEADVPSVDDDGNWHNNHNCDPGEALVGFQTRVMRRGLDDYGIAGIRIFCRRYT